MNELHEGYRIMFGTFLQSAGVYSLANAGIMAYKHFRKPSPKRKLKRLIAVSEFL